MFRSQFVRSKGPKPGSSGGRHRTWEKLPAIRRDSTRKAGVRPVKFQRAVNFEAIRSCVNATKNFAVSITEGHTKNVRFRWAARSKEEKIRREKKISYQRLPRSPRSPRSPPRPPPPRPPRSPPRPPPPPPYPPRPPPPPERSVCGRASLTTRFRPPKF